MENDKTHSNTDRNTTSELDGKTVIEDVKEQAQDVAGKVTDQASDYAAQAKDVAADEVQGVASALRTAANELREGSPQAKTFSQIAETLADAADSLRGKDLGQMMNAANAFARRNPLIFLGSAALVGFAATRFAKASSTGYSLNEAGNGPGSQRSPSFVALRDSKSDAPAAPSPRASNEGSRS